jgi:hypothetical protein
VGEGLRNNNNLLALGFTVLLNAWFFADLVESKVGERVGAFGAVIGGIIGAGGAVFAVYLAFTRQRTEDTEKVRSAVRTEVISYTKYAIGTLKVCEHVATGLVTIPMSDAAYIGKNLIEPTVYNAVADRVALLQKPQVTIEFHMRIAEAKSHTTTYGLTIGSAPVVSWTRFEEQTPNTCRRTRRLFPTFSSSPGSFCRNLETSHP